MRSPLNDLLPPISRDRHGMLLPGAILVTLLLISLLAPAITHQDPRHTISGAAYMPPSSQHYFGTDTLGRDVFSRTLWGGRTTLGTALLATMITIIPGLAIGVLAGFVGGWIERLLMGAMDVLLAFPNLLLALGIITLTGTGRNQIAVAVGIAGLPAYARLARTATRDIRTTLYIEAACGLGATALHVLRYHVVPNILETLLSFAGISLSWAILNTAALAFLGFGGDPATPDWGVMLNEGRAAFRVAPWIAIPPGMAITIAIYSINRLVDSWQDIQSQT